MPNSLEKNNDTGLAGYDDFMQTFDSLMRKLVDSMSASHPGPMISPLSDFVQVTGLDYTPSDRVRDKIREQVEKRIVRTLMQQKCEDIGRHEPFELVGELCQWGIIANQLGISYDLEPRKLDGYFEDPLMDMDGLSTNIADVLNFELHHFDYKGELKYLGPFLPLDIIYFAELNGITGSLEGRLISDLDDRCRIPEIRQATPDEARQRLEYFRERKKDGHEDVDFDIEKLEHLLDGDPDKAKGWTFYWNDSDGVELVFPRLTPERAESLIPRQPHTTETVRRYLGPELEAALAKHCEKGRYKHGRHDEVTEVLYRRNRVKDFLGGDIKVPKELAEHDDAEFSTTDPKAIKMWVENMVAVFGPKDIGCELVLPNLSKEEYRVYRTIKKAMQYVRQGHLTYDTEEKRQMLTTSFSPLSELPRMLLPEQAGAQADEQLDKKPGNLDPHNPKKSDLQRDVTYLLCPDSSCNVFDDDVNISCEEMCIDVAKLVRCISCDEFIELPRGGSMGLRLDLECSAGHSMSRFDKDECYVRIYKKPE
jgi:hypothetical protein